MERFSTKPTPAAQRAARTIRLRLTGKGLALVLGDPLNQIRYTLGRHARAITLKQLYAGNTITPDDVLSAEDAGHITVVVTGDLPAEGDWFSLPPEHLWLALTRNGRKYLPS